MVFTKYISFYLVSPQSGLRPVFPDKYVLIRTLKIHHLHVFDHPQNNECRSPPVCSKETRCIQTSFFCFFLRLMHPVSQDALVGD